MRITRLAAPPASRPVHDLYEEVRFRLRAARYGFRFTKRPPAADLFTYITTAAAILVVALSLLRELSPLLRGLVLAMEVGSLLAALVWWHSRLSRIFGRAAASDTHASTVRADLRRGLENVGAYEQINALYIDVVDHTNKIVESSGVADRFGYVGTNHGVTFSVIAVPMSDANSLKTLLVGDAHERPRTWQRWAGEFANERQALIRRWRGLDGYRDTDDESGWNLVLDSLEVTASNGGSSNWQAHASQATYGQIVRTSDSLLNEFALFAFLASARERRSSLSRIVSGFPVGAWILKTLRVGHEIRFTTQSALLRQLKWPRAIHRQTGQLELLFLAPVARGAGLGVAVTTLMPNERGELTAWVGMRSALVGTYPDVLHVIPAGMCNSKDLVPVGPTPVRGIPADFLEYTIWSEFFEEWKGVKEFESMMSHRWRSDIDQYRRKDELDGTELSLTGLAFDLLNLRPEVCAVLTLPRDIRSDLNYEYVRGTPPRPLSLEHLDEMPSCAGYVQSGVASLALAQLRAVGVAE